LIRTFYNELYQIVLNKGKQLNASYIALIKSYMESCFVSNCLLVSIFFVVPVHASSFSLWCKKFTIHDLISILFRCHGECCLSSALVVHGPSWYDPYGMLGSNVVEQRDECMCREHITLIFYCL